MHADFSCCSIGHKQIPFTIYVLNRTDSLHETESLLYKALSLSDINAVVSQASFTIILILRITKRMPTDISLHCLCNLYIHRYYSLREYQSLLDDHVALPSYTLSDVRETLFGFIGEHTEYVCLDNGVILSRSCY